MRYKKPAEQELFIHFTSYEQLHYIDNPPLEDSVKVFYKNREQGVAQIWYDAKMNHRQYIIINHTIEYLDTLNTMTPIKEVIYRVCDEYCVTRIDINSNRRNVEYCEPRHILFYILRTHYKMGLQDIADMFNRLSHATVLSGIKRIKNAIELRPSVEKHVNMFFEKINTNKRL